MRVQRKFFEVATIILSIGLSLVLFELFLRWTYPQVDEVDRMFSFDPHLGWAFVPSKSGVIIYPGEAHLKIETNSWGFRDSDFDSIGEGLSRLMVVGDSFTSNIAVEREFVFTEVMEQVLEDSSVLNFGVNGYSTVQELLVMKRYLAAVKPDLVIAMLYMRNDLEENIRKYWFYPRPTATLTGQKIELKLNLLGDSESADSSPNEWPIDRGSSLHLARLFTNSRATLSALLADRAAPSPVTLPESYLCSKDPSDDVRSMLNVMKGLMLEMKRFADTESVPICFVLAPSFIQANVPLWNEVFEANGENWEDLDRTRPNSELMEFAESEGLLAIDLLPFLERRDKNEPELYNQLEQHWNKLGNDTVAHVLLRELEKQGLLSTDNSLKNGN